jgi:hypothetical protein
MCFLNLKSGETVLASIGIVTKQNDKPLVPILSHDNTTVRFAASQNGEIYFEITNCTEFDLKIDILNTNMDKINKINLLKPYKTIRIERNEILGCAMVLAEYITDRGEHLYFDDEKSRCFGLLKVGFDRTFGVTTSWEVSNYRPSFPPPQTFGVTSSGNVPSRKQWNSQQFIPQHNGEDLEISATGCVFDSRGSSSSSNINSSTSRRTGIRTENDGGIEIANTSRALLKPGCTLEQVKFKETKTTEKFYASIKFDFGLIKRDHTKGTEQAFRTYFSTQ